MTVFEPSLRLRSGVIDPHQRVNYTLGMVLGVDDFVQETTWHTEALRQSLRDLVGYGTVRGLGVSARATLQGPEVVVTPGVALSPRGETVRVAAEQCAALNDWLRTGGRAAEADRRSHQEAVDDAVVLGSALDTGQLRLYVVLDWAECTTVPRPIPGEPCRREDDVLVDSRIQDGFALSLELHPPQQIELQGMQGFLDFIGRVPIADIPPPTSGLASFLEALRDAAHGSPPGPPFMTATVPAGLIIPASRAAQWRRAALRLYVTELRAHADWLAPGQNATGAPPTRGGADRPPAGVLLAELDLRVLRTQGNVWQMTADADAVRVDDSQRPFLVPHDLLEETALQGVAALANLATARVPARIIAAGSLPILASTASPLPTSTPNTLGAAVAQEQGDGNVRVIFTPLDRAGVSYCLYATPMQPPADNPAELRSASIVSGPSPFAPADPRQVFELHLRDAAGLVPLASLRNMGLSVQILAFAADGV